MLLAAMTIIRRLWCFALHRDDHLICREDYMHRVWECRDCGRTWTECRR